MGALTKIKLDSVFMPLAKVMPHTGPQSRSEEKFTNRTRKIPKADGMVPNSLTVAESYFFKLFSHSKNAPELAPAFQKKISTSTTIQKCLLLMISLMCRKRSFPWRACPALSRRLRAMTRSFSLKI